MMPEVLRDAISRPRLEADFEDGDYSIQFSTSDDPIIDSIIAEVRGNGNPIPVLHSICVDTGWCVIDAAENVVDLTTADTASWDNFREWRDKALRHITSQGEKK